VGIKSSPIGSKKRWSTCRELPARYRPAHPVGRSKILWGRGVARESPECGEGQPQTDPPAAAHVPTHPFTFSSATPPRTSLSGMPSPETV
jgi:hypothetical protein